MEVQGGCLCGKVRFQLKGTVNGFYFCHCTRCQKSTGSAHGSNLFFRNAELHWEQGEETCAHYQHEGTRFAKCFCAHCGCPLPKVIDSEHGIIQVPAGCLDGDQDFELTAHLFTDSKKCWEDKLPYARQFVGLPTS